MAYHTGHRLDCDLSSDPIECFCGPPGWGNLPPAPIGSKMTIERKAPDTKMDVLFVDAALQMIRGRAYAAITGIENPLARSNGTRRD